MKLKHKIILLFVTSSLMPVLLLQAYLGNNYSVQHKNKISEMIVQNLSQKKIIINNEIEDYLQIFISIITDPLYIDTLDALLREKLARSAYLSHIIENIFSRKTYLKKGLLGFLYFDLQSGLLLDYNKQQIPPEDIVAALGGKTKMVDIVEKNGGAIGYLNLISVESIVGVPQHFIVLGSRFPDLNRTSLRGYIFLLVSEKSIYKLLNPYTPSSYRNFSLPETWLLASDETVISGKDKLSLGEVFKVSEMPNFDAKEIYLTREVVIDKLDWKIVTTFKESELFGEVNVFRMILIFIVILSVFLTFIVIRYYKIRVVNSITALKSSMKIENDQFQFSVNANDDLEYVNHSFHNMKHHIDGLLLEQSQKNKKMLAFQKEKRLAEIKAMEAQVNPHFLYNTLNSLNWMALEKDDVTMSEALTDLAGILRYSISDLSVHTVLKKEIMWLEQYLRLQKLRFVNLFEYNLKWDNSRADFKMYKLLFQPFIENAIIHGFRKINYLGELNITVSTCENKKIRIIIKDNGKGFDVKKMTASTGVNNPASRLNLYYGEEAQLDIQSQVGKGTTIALLVPEITCESADN